MILYCPFDGKVLTVTKKSASCFHCDSQFTLVIKHECLRQILINACGKECTC